MENNDTLEVIQRIPLDKLRPYPDHPFGVRDDDMMQQTVESIKQFGVLVPGIARPLPDGSFELIAGHRRKQASAIAGLTDMPIIVRDIDRNAATIIMVDSNLQRENILPSEKAKAYKMKLEAIKRQAGRPGKNSAQLGQNFEGKTSRAQIAENSPDSSSQIQRYIRLNELEPELLQLVDEGKIGMTPAVEISYLKPDEQRLLIETIDSEQATPSFSQAQRMDRLQLQLRIRFNGSGILTLIVENLHLRRSAGELPAGMRAEIMEHFLLFGGLRVKLGSLWEIGNRKMNILRLDTAIDPAGVDDLFDHPSLGCHLFKMSADPCVIKKGQRFHAAFCALHQFSSFPKIK